MNANSCGTALSQPTGQPAISFYAQPPATVPLAAKSRAETNNA